MSVGRSGRSTDHGAAWAARGLGRCGIAVLLVGGACFFQWLLWSRLPASPHLFFYPAVMVAAWIGDLLGGLLAIALSSAAIAYFFLTPTFSFAVGSSRDALDLAVYALLCAVLVAFVVRLRRALEAKESARRAAEEASSRLAHEQALLRSVFDHVTVGLGFASADGVCQFDNPALRQMTGGVVLPSSIRDVPGRYGLCWPDGRALSVEEWERAVGEAAEKPVTLDVSIRRSDGSSLVTALCLAPVREEPSGRLVGTVGMCRDVSAERAIAELREELGAVIAHDLRSPIAAIHLSLESAGRPERPATR
jgi:PAS domain S-box-containing protein